MHTITCCKCVVGGVVVQNATLNRMLADCCGVCFAGYYMYIYIAVMRCVEGRRPNVNKVLETDCRMYKKFWITKLDSEVQNAMDLWFGTTQRCCLKIQDSRRFDASHQDC